MSLLHGPDGLTNVLGLAEMAGCQVDAEGCLARVMSFDRIFSSCFVASPVSLIKIYQKITNLIIAMTSYSL